MKQLLILTFILLCVCSSSFAQISNVTVRVSDEQDKVTITYNLDRSAPSFNIQVRIAMVGEVINARGLSGDVGSRVLPGLGKKIVWDVHQDVTELLAGELKIDVTTDTKPQTKGNAPCPLKTTSTYAGLGGVVASGAGLFVGGLAIEGNSKELYDTYKSFVDPSDPVYSEVSRSEHYDEANKKHKQATLLLVAGGAVLVAGGIVFISRLIKINNYNKTCAGKIGASPSPRWDIQPAIDISGLSPNLGLSLSYHF